MVIYNLEINQDWKKCKVCVLKGNYRHSTNDKGRTEGFWLWLAEQKTEVESTVTKTNHGWRLLRNGDHDGACLPSYRAKTKDIHYSSKKSIVFTQFESRASFEC